MMWLCCQNWVFQLDKERSNIYSASEAASHCLCDYCRNFYATIDAQYPGLRPLLEDFGIDIEAPDMMIPLEPATNCVLFYSVAGEILQTRKKNITVDGLEIIPQSENPGSVSLDAPCFFLRVEGVHLPWELPLSIEHVASSANG